MKTSKKILAMLLAVAMVIGVVSLSGCKAKQKEPQELFMNALQMYEDAIEENKIVKMMSNASTKGSVSVNMKSYKDSETEDINVTVSMYMDQAGNAASAVADMKVNGETYDVKLLLSDKKVVLGSNLIENAYGINFDNAVKNFPTSLFGTKGDNMLGLTEEDEAEVLKVLQDLVDAMKATPNDVDLDKTVDDLFVKYAKFAAEYDTESNIRNENVKSTIVYATMTKTGLKSMVNELVNTLDAQETINELLKTYNEMASLRVIEDENVKEFKSINDVIDDVFDKYQDNENVLTITMALDSKHDAIMSMDVTFGSITCKFVVGKNPREIKQVDIAVTADGETTKLTLTIDEGATATKYQLIDENNDGVVVTINEAHKKVTCESMSNGKINDEDSYSFGYNLTDNELALVFNNDETEMTVTLTVKANDESPVKYTDFKDLFTMSTEDVEALLTELAPYFEALNPEEPEYDDEYDDEFDDIWDDEWDDEWTDVEDPEYDEDWEIN